MKIPLLLNRPPMLDRSQLEQIEETTLRILDQVGVRVLNDRLFDYLKGRGFHVKGDRVCIERMTVQEFIEAERKRNGNMFGVPASAGAADPPITVFTSNYPLHVHDWRADVITPFTTERLIEATKLVDVLTDRGLVSSPPGNPYDVPPPLQPIVQYWIAATYSRNGKASIDPKAAVSFPYVKEMSAILGDPIRSLTVWLFTPLTLGGESLEMVLAFAGELSAFGVSSMPALGSTAPIHAGDAFAVSAAEVIGSAILLRERLDLPCYWEMGLQPVDMRSMAMIFGSPENYLFQLMSCEVSAYFHGKRWQPAAGNIHSNAKLPGPQACAEKASLMTAGALLGARYFGAVGTLSLDEVFSAEQLVYDLEIKDHVQRLVQGMDADCDTDRCLSDLADGLREKGFAGLIDTVETHRDIYWKPQLFERDFLGAWRNSGSRSIRDKAHGLINELLSRHDYALDESLRKGIDQVLERAKAKFLGNYELGITN